MKFILAGLLCILLLPICAQMDSLRAIIDSKPNNEETVLWICDTAFPYWGRKPDLAESLAKMALKRAETLDYTEGKARANHVIGVTYWARDLYEFAIQHYLEALKYYEEIGELKGIANINMNIGAVYDDLGQYDRAKVYELKALELHRQRNDSIGINRALNNLGVLYKRMGNIDSSYLFYRESLPIRQAFGDTLGVARIYNNIAVIQLEHDEESEAIENLTIARELLVNIPDYNLISSVYTNFGKGHTILSNYGLAQSYLDSAVEAAVKVDALSKEQVAYQYLKDLALAQGQKERAFDYLRQEVELDKTIRSEKVSKQIEKISAQYENEKKERMLAELEKENAKEQGLRRVVTISLVSSIIIGLALIYAIIMRNRRNKQKAEIKVLKLKEELNSKNKEISSYTLNFIQRNEVMEELKAQINELKKKSTPDTNMELNRINRMVNDTFRADDEWETFRLTFEQMHDGFFSALKEKYPDLGNAELKLCALLRLNMNLKESASVLGISPDSVKTARYRLRKKLGMKTEDNLVDFLIRFEQESVTADSELSS